MIVSGRSIVLVLLPFGSRSISNRECALLVAATAATALFASCSAATLASSHAAKVSTSQNLVGSFGTNKDIGGEKRFLRYHDKDPVELGEENADEEERKGTNLFLTSKLDEILDGTQVMSRFKK
ncbi:RXLR domain-containing protein [Phytophthora infestans]|uniref:RxLR effector protein n=1 Tax=Phytophthora infestans TaxID=4787 RepID=A0A833SSG8_PHYIN|nr:RXLR domain-containing protein [Phytophthora infestans]KAF4138641.1 RXLR effector domain-containing protein [Phytophthora infestans]